MKYTAFLGLLCLVIVHSRGKILRFGYKFFGRFTLVDGNSRLTSDRAISVAEKTTLPKCTYECMKEKRCKSINHNEEEEICELLDATKFDHPNALQQAVKWKHYETDDDAENIGEICEKLSPCKAHEVCEDTNRQPPYICRCREGFEGDKCHVYKGPGYETINPVASCRALFEKFKSAPDGLYWIKGGRNQVNCTRKVDGGYSQWSDYGPCSATCGTISIQVRRRSCTEPAPKGRGRSCKRFGTDTQTRTCSVAQPFCNCSSALQHGVSTLTLEFGHLNGKVDCGIYNDHAVTYFSHDAEQICYFNSENGVRSRNINYINTIEFVTKAVQMFANCKQTFHVRCANQAPGDSYFENTKGEKLHVHNGDCVGCYDVIKNDIPTREGDAYIVNKKYLPLVKMVFLDTDAAVEFMEIKLDKLICW